MIERFARDDLIPADQARSLYAMLSIGNNPQAVAETIRSTVPRDAYYSFLQDQFSYIPSRPSAAHSLLFRLKPPLIITTNYDRLIEHAYANLTGQALSVVVYSQPGQVRNKLLSATQEGKPFLFKLHGDIDNPSDLVLTGSDYERLKRFYDGYRLLLSSIFFHYTTLFIGFSLQDAEIMLHIRNVQEALHGERYPDYALLATGACSESEVAQFRHDFGIQILCYEDKNHKHRGIVRFLTQLSIKGEK